MKRVKGARPVGRPKGKRCGGVADCARRVSSEHRRKHPGSHCRWCASMLRHGAGLTSSEMAALPGEFWSFAEIEAIVSGERMSPDRETGQIVLTDAGRGRKRIGGKALPDTAPDQCLPSLKAPQSP